MRVGSRANQPPDRAAQPVGQPVDERRPASASGVPARKHGEPAAGTPARGRSDLAQRRVAHVERRELAAVGGDVAPDAVQPLGVGAAEELDRVRRSPRDERQVGRARRGLRAGPRGRRRSMSRTSCASSSEGTLRISFSSATWMRVRQLAHGRGGIGVVRRAQAGRARAAGPPTSPRRCGTWRARRSAARSAAARAPPGPPGANSYASAMRAAPVLSFSTLRSLRLVPSGKMSTAPPPSSRRLQSANISSLRCIWSAASSRR